jgi:O-antigen ligase
VKNPLFINDTVANKISYYHLAFFLITLPFDFFYSQLILVSYAIHTLIHAEKNDWKSVFTPPVLIITLFFLMNLLALSYSSDKQEGINLLTRQLAIIIFPVFFGIGKIDLERYKESLLCIFSFTCVATVMYLYADAMRIIQFYQLPFPALFSTLFMNHNFSLPIGIHATYLSVYVAFSLLFFLYLLIRKKELPHKWIYIFSSVMLLAGLIQLSSRAVFIAFLLVLNLVFPFLLFTAKKRLAFFVMAALLSATVMLIILNVDSFKARYISELKTDLTNKVKIIESTEPRLARWNAIAELIKKSPVIGYGTGSEKKMLKEEYFEKGLYISYLNEFNTHSEYLGILLRTGVVGLLVFVYILYFGFAAATRKADIIFLNFMIIVAVVSVSENFLELNKGIFFYSFFFSLFLWKKGQVLKKEKTVTGNRLL